MRIIRHVGNYGEVYERNVGTGSKLGIPRGLNALWTQGGILVRAAHSLNPAHQRTRGSTMSGYYLVLARVLLTLVTLGYGFGTILADFNKTHATNPKWTPHARFHVVWQICSYVGFGLLALALLWWPGPYAIERLVLVAVMAAIVYAAFFRRALRHAGLWRRRL